MGLLRPAESSRETRMRPACFGGQEGSARLSARALSAPTMTSYLLDHLQHLETEAIHIMREVAGEFERPALLFSGGKDSTVLVHLAKKAFLPAQFPFPLLHIDTGHNFPEALAFRDELVKQTGQKLIVRNVGDTIKAKNLSEPKGKFASRNALQTYTLLD